MPEGSFTIQFVQTTGWILFSATAALSIALGLMLSYHWIHFAMNRVVPIIAIGIYCSTIFLLLSIMLGAVMAL